MAEKDKLKWDKKFTAMPDLLSPRPPSQLVEKYLNFVNSNMALDLACGGGRHTLYLDHEGFFIDSVDISKVALQKLKSKVSDRVTLIEADLDNYTPKENHYDLIIKTNFLDRELIKRATKALKIGGVFIIETYMKDKENEKQDSLSDFLLLKGELLTYFDEGFKVLEYLEFWNEDYEKFRMKKQAIAVQKVILRSF